jgi:DNA-binding PadR family transcriptional regulator
MSQTLKGFLDPMILAVLADEPLHGYAVIEELKLRSGGELDLPEGTVYPALHRLERAGLLGSDWAEAHPGNARRRRVYRLTGRGHTALAEREREWARFADGVGGVLRGATP